MIISIVAQLPENLLFQYRITCKKFPGKPGGKIELTENKENFSFYSPYFEYKTTKYHNEPSALHLYVFIPL